MQGSLIDHSALVGRLCHSAVGRSKNRCGLSAVDIPHSVSCWNLSLH